MIFGWYNFKKGPTPALDEVQKAFRVQTIRPESSILTARSVFVFLPENVPSIDIESGVFHSKTGAWQGVFQGDLFEEKGETSSKEYFGRLLRQKGIASLVGLHGSFAGAIFQPEKDQFFLFRDHLGIESLYYLSQGDRIYFSSSLKQLSNATFYEKQINYQALYRYLLFNYNPGLDTFFADIQKLRAGHLLSLQGRKMEIKPYWKISYRERNPKPLEVLKKDLLQELDAVVQVRLPHSEKKTGVFLSGGMDSSSVVGLSAPKMTTPLHTFSFRCKGKGFDESYYADFMSRHYGTNHHLVEYPPERITELGELVSYMEEPFSDIGIEIASFLLGKEARNQVDVILTGDGGDELFAGHPVYLAEKMSRKYDVLPRFLKRGIYKISRLLPDTEEKKSFSVKVKRFSYSAQFPQDLYSNRWRMYYTSQEIKNLVRDDLWERLESTEPLAYFYELYAEADGDDYLSKSLYADYFTVVDFYLRRMAVLRNFGIEARFPLLDPDIVAFSTKIPPELKINKSGETKYIQHVTMAGVLPDEIVFRKDKLGHSVPMKNWMRENDFVKHYIYDRLDKSTIERRGLFRLETIQKLIQEHLSKKENHSHRIWSLMVLEMWLKENFNP